MNEYDEMEKIQKLIEERHRIFREIRKLTEALSTKTREEAENEIIQLLEKTHSLRNKMEKSLTLLEDYQDPELREYVVTLFDFIRLVDMDDEEDILKELVDYAKRTKGPLSNKLEWLEKEAEKTGYLGERLKWRTTR